MSRKDLLWIIAVTSIVFIIQLRIWSTLDFIDKQVWVDHTQKVADWSRGASKPVTYGHPNTAQSTLAILIQNVAAISLAQAFVLAFSLINTLAIAASILIAKKFWPVTLWWLGIAAVLLINPLYINATPPTASASMFVILLVLIGMKIFEEQKDSPLNALWAIVLGLTATTRLDMAGYVGGTLLIAMFPKIGLRAVVKLVLITGATFFALNPFMWHAPLQHVIDLFNITIGHYEGVIATGKTNLRSQLSVSPIALLGLVATTALLYRRKLPTELPARYIAWLAASTYLFIIGVQFSAFLAPRYFYPFAFLWEVIFLGLIIFSVQQKPPNDLTPSTSHQHRLASLAIFIFFAINLVSFNLLVACQVNSLPRCAAQYVSVIR